MYYTIGYYDKEDYYDIGDAELKLTAYAVVPEYDTNYDFDPIPVFRDYEKCLEFCNAVDNMIPVKIADDEFGDDFSVIVMDNTDFTLKSKRRPSGAMQYFIHTQRFNFIYNFEEMYSVYFDDAEYEKVLCKNVKELANYRGVRDSGVPDDKKYALIDKRLIDHFNNYGYSHLSR
jgi:hypothetical protein